MPFGAFLLQIAYSIQSLVPPTLPAPPPPHTLALLVSGTSFFFIYASEFLYMSINH